MEGTARFGVGNKSRRTRRGRGALYALRKRARPGPRGEGAAACFTHTRTVARTLYCARIHTATDEAPVRPIFAASPAADGVVRGYPFISANQWLQPRGMIIFQSPAQRQPHPALFIHIIQ